MNEDGWRDRSPARPYATRYHRIHCPPKNWRMKRAYDPISPGASLSPQSLPPLRTVVLARGGGCEGMDHSFIIFDDTVVIILFSRDLLPVAQRYIDENESRE